MKAKKILKQISKEALEQIGDVLGFVPSARKHKARRFIIGMYSPELLRKNWNYDEILNYGDMHKVLTIEKIIKKDLKGSKKK